MSFSRLRDRLVAPIASLVAAIIFSSGALAQGAPPAAASSSTGEVPTGQSSVATNSTTVGWFVVGRADRSAFLQALTGGRALLCENLRCAIWDSATGTSTPTEGPSVLIDTLAHIRLRDGNVVTIDVTRRNWQMWDHVTGHWKSGAPLPESLREIRLAELLDGRIVAAGETARSQARAYVADAHFTEWSILVDGPKDLTNASIVPMEWGALLSRGVRMWRYVIGTEGWRPLEAATPLSARSISVKPWGEELLVTYQEAGRWTASILGRDGQLRPAAALPNTGSRFDPISIGTSGATNMWLLPADKGYYLWRRPDEPPIPLPSDLVALSSSIVATNAEQLLGVALSGPLIEVSLNGIRPPGHACDGLLRYVSEAPPYPSYGSERVLVSVECREEARRGDAPALLALVRSMAAGPGRADVGRAFECALQDQHAVDELPQWFRGEMEEHARSVCYQSLATWPAASGVWKLALDGAVYERPDHWYVDGAVIEWASVIATPEVHERLLPVVRAAAAHHAVGFDMLRSAVCERDPGSSEARRETCADLASQHETDWRQEEANLGAQRQRSASVKRHTPWIIASTVVVGGAVTAAYAARDSEVGRGIAVASGALAGAAIGFTAAALSALNGNWVSKSGNELPPTIAGAMLLGAALGGVGAYLSTSSPGARAPVTGAALAFPYLLTLAISFD